MDELVAFVRRCLDEDARVAREALHADAVQPGAWMTERHDMDSEHPNTCHIAEDRSGYYWSVAHEVYIPNAKHIARWDPARVLAEVEVKRRILDLHHETEMESEPDHEPLGAGCAECAHFDWPCDTIRLQTQPYAGQDGWQEEWRV